MFESILKAIKNRPEQDEQITRRRYTRRKTDQCISVVNGQAFPVEDWSIGGLLIAGDGRLFAEGKNYDIMLKFKLRDNIVEVLHRAKVVRKNRNRIGMEFAPLTTDIRNKFKMVVDDYVTQQFAGSQMA